MKDQVVPAPLSLALSQSSEDSFKPAMVGQRSAFPTTPAYAEAGQGLRPVDPQKKRPLPSVLGIKLTPDLRSRIAAAAQVAGVSDSAWLRARALEALGTTSPVDAVSGRRPRVAPEAQVALAGVVRALGEATLAVKGGRVDEGVAAMERARRAIIPVVLGFERRPS